MSMGTMPVVISGSVAIAHCPASSYLPSRARSSAWETAVAICSEERLCVPIKWHILLHCRRIANISHGIPHALCRSFEFSHAKRMRYRHCSTGVKTRHPSLAQVTRKDCKIILDMRSVTGDIGQSLNFSVCLQRPCKETPTIHRTIALLGLRKENEHFSAKNIGDKTGGTFHDIERPVEIFILCFDVELRGDTATRMRNRKRIPACEYFLK